MRNALGFLIAFGLLATPAVAGTVDFSGYTHGKIINDEYSGIGVTISAVNNKNGSEDDLAMIFDSGFTGNTSDGDLLFKGGWSKGNAKSTDLGNLLIISENNTGIGDDVGDDPDDQAGSNAGHLLFEFDEAIYGFGVTLVDIEAGSETSGFTAVILSDDSVVASIDFGSFAAGSSSDFATSGVVYGNRSANKIGTLTASELSAYVVKNGGTAFSSFDAVKIKFDGSGAVGELTYVVPLPSALWMGLGLIGIVGAAQLMRRRRQQMM